MFWIESQEFLEFFGLKMVLVSIWVFFHFFMMLDSVLKINWKVPDSVSKKFGIKKVLSHIKSIYHNANVTMLQWNACKIKCYNEMLQRFHKSTYNSRGLCLVSVSSVAWKLLVWNEETIRMMMMRMMLMMMIMILMIVMIMMIMIMMMSMMMMVGGTLGECRVVAQHGLVAVDADAVAAQMCSSLRSLKNQPW